MDKQAILSQHIYDERLSRVSFNTTADSAGGKTSLKGRVGVGLGFGLLTKEEVIALLTSQVFCYSGKFGNELIPQKLLGGVEVRQFTLRGGLLSFELSVVDFSPDSHTQLFLRAPGCIRTRGKSFEASEDGLTYALDVADVPEGTLIEVSSHGKAAPGVSSGKYLASIADGKIIDLGGIRWRTIRDRLKPEIVEHGDDLESVTIEGGLVTVRLCVPLRGQRPGIHSTLWTRLGDDNNG